MILLKNEIRKDQKLNYQSHLKGFYNKFQKEYSGKFNKLLKNIRDSVSLDDIQQSIALGQLVPGVEIVIRETIMQFAESNLDDLTHIAFDTVMRDLDKRLPDVDFSQVTLDDLQNSISENFIESMTSQQVKALNEAFKLCNYSFEISQLSMEDVSQIIQRGSGLNSVLLKSSLRLFATMNNNQVPPFQAKKQIDKMINEKMAYRSKVLSTDAILASYRNSEYELVDYAAQKGYLKNVVKRWLTAGDNRVCPICEDLDKKVVPYNKPFETSDGVLIFDTEGAHALCRCAVEYMEKETYDLGIYDRN